MQQVKFWTDITAKEREDKSLPTYGTVVTFISEHIHLEFTKIRLPDATKPEKRGRKVLSSVARNKDQPMDYGGQARNCFYLCKPSFRWLVMIAV